MPYCQRCRAELTEGDRFCPNCGAQVSPWGPEEYVAGTGLERIGSDRALQQHWIYRVIALVVDVIVVVFAVFFIVLLTPILAFPSIFRIGGFISWVLGFFGLFMGLIFFLYFSFAEAGYGCTLGKRVVGLKVVTVDGARPSLEKAFIRNVSKIHWVLLLLDVVGGLATSGDPRQKFSDRVAGTTIVGAYT